MSTQDTAVPKRRSSAANRRRKHQAGIRSGQPPASQRASDEQLQEAPVPSLTDDAVPSELVSQTRRGSRAARKASAREAVAATEPAELRKERHLQRKEERREAKSRRVEKSGARRFINTDRFGGLQSFYNDAASEIRKVQWPDRETTRNLTIVVIALSVVLGVLLGGIDYVLFQLFEAMT